MAATRPPLETPKKEVVNGEPLGKHTDTPGKWKGYEKEATRLAIYRRKSVEELKKSWRQVKMCGTGRAAKAGL